LIQHYVIQFVSGFCLGTPVSSTNNTDRHDIAEIVESDVKHQHSKAITLTKS